MHSVQTISTNVRTALFLAIVTLNKNYWVYTRSIWKFTTPESRANARYMHRGVKGSPPLPSPKDEGPPGAITGVYSKVSELVHNLNDDARANGATTLADGEA